MKQTITCTILCILITATFSKEGAGGMYDYLEPKDNEVAIHFNCIEVPLDRILLIRKDLHCCALKFTRLWTDNDGKEKYADYEVYYQGDGTGNFANNNVTRSEGRASEFPLRGPFRPFIYQPGDSYVKCGPFKLGWNYKKKVAVMPPDKGLGDFGFELAPTPWTDIKEVDIKDQRVKWYRYEEKRKRVFIPIDKLWE
ncbi:MAG: hypothetical protein A2521_03960 [Deltaproteobacteria bacterium RIFOXYD12_FULL_57_12]|nr:MAG: hypothetical protein A2521_03960 [Deltaproteobacteria bacterium RIFOXYD12_FULL_57_12]